MDETLKKELVQGLLCVRQLQKSPEHALHPFIVRTYLSSVKDSLVWEEDVRELDLLLNEVEDKLVDSLFDESKDLPGSQGSTEWKYTEFSAVAKQDPPPILKTDDRKKVAFQLPPISQPSSNPQGLTWSLPSSEEKRPEPLKMITRDDIRMTYKPENFPQLPPPQPLKVERSKNNFTSALDEFKVTCHFKGKDYKQQLALEAAGVTKREEPKGAKGVLSHFFNSDAGGQQQTGRKAYKPPFKDTQSKEEKDGRSEHPLADWAVAEGLDISLIEAVEHEILDQSPMVDWRDIAGLDEAKKVINETIIFPNLRPDIFTGLRKPSKGILLFGPPGTGKTMIGRAIAGQLQSTFFNISSSSLVSKWVGESEKLIRTLFRVAALKQPSVIFVDEIDSMLSVRGDAEADVVRRIKTEFFVQIDGAKTSEDDRVLIIGTTNRPEQLDEAARRRFTKRLYIPLPDNKARLELFKALIAKEKKGASQVCIEEAELEEAVKRSQGYSCADIVNVMKEAAMGPVRDLMSGGGVENCRNWNAAEMRAIKIDDVLTALTDVKSSVSVEEIQRYLDWNVKFGTSKVSSE